MSSSIKVSVIIPVYNGEQFLERCLDSLSNQDYENIEIIIINDGSTDNTEAICASYVQREPRAKVVNKDNQGVSTARNLGLSLVTGDYIYFVDADDYVLSEGIEGMVQKAIQSSADLIVAEYYAAHGENKTKVTVQTSHQPNDFLCSILLGDNHSALWNKLLKKDLLVGIEFPIDIRYMEDKVFMCQLLLTHQPKIERLETPVYVYWLGDHSVTGANDMRMLDIFAAYKMIEKYITQLSDDKRVIEAFATCIYESIWFVLMTIDKRYLKQAIISAKQYTKSMSKYRGYSSPSAKVQILLTNLKLPLTLATPTIASMQSALNQLSFARRQARR